jgi:putative metallohydrolase (TIGR04338 family)
MPEHAYEAQFWQNMRNTGGLNSKPGIPSGPPPQRYVVDGPTKALYDAQFALMRDLDAATLAAEFAPTLVRREFFFASPEAMEQWVRDVQQYQWSHLRAGLPEPIKVVLHDPLMFAYRSATILAPRARPLAWRGIFLVHELAHHYGEPTGHGLTFVRTMLDLMGTIYDQRTADRFRHHLIERGVQT